MSIDITEQKYYDYKYCLAVRSADNYELCIVHYALFALAIYAQHIVVYHL